MAIACPSIRSPHGMEREGAWGCVMVKGILLVASLGLVMSISACDGKGGRSASGPGGGGTVTETLSGVAAVGAPLAGATVALRCEGGDFEATTSGQGAWSVQVPQGSAPCLLRVSGGTPPVTLYSYAASAGRVNITPLTTLALARAVATSTGETDLESFFGQASVDLGALAAPVLNAGSDVVNGLVNAGYAGASGLDVFGAAFSASAGDAYDDLLEAFADALAREAQTFDDFLAAWQGNAPFPPADPDAGGEPGEGGCGAVGVQPRPTAAALLGTCAGTYEVTGTATEPQGRGVENAPHVRGTIIVTAAGAVDFDTGINFGPADINTVFDRTTQDFDRRVQVNYDADDSGRRIDFYIDAQGRVQEIRFGRPTQNGSQLTRALVSRVGDEDPVDPDPTDPDPTDPIDPDPTDPDPVDPTDPDPVDPVDPDPTDPTEPGAGFSEIANGVAFVRMSKPEGANVFALGYVRDTDGAGRVLFSRPVDISEGLTGVRAYHFAHLKADGSLDTSKGDGGITRVCGSCSADHPLWQWNGAENQYSWNLSVAAVLPDGRMIAVLASRAVRGFENSFFPMHDRALVRFTRDGELDTSFGEQGVLQLKIDNEPVRFYSFAGTSIPISYQPDGNGHLLVFVGHSRVMKVDSDGGIVTSFADNGVLTMERSASPHQFLLDTEGDIFVFRQTSTLSAIGVAAGTEVDVPETYTVGSYRLTAHPLGGALMIRKDNPTAQTHIRHLGGDGEEVANVRVDVGALHRDGQFIWLDDNRLLFTSLASDSASGAVSRAFAVYDVGLNAIDNPYAEGCGEADAGCIVRFYNEAAYPLPDGTVRHPHFGGSTWSGFIQEGDGAYYHLYEDFDAWVLTRFPKH
jgi:hypothetical protein